MSTKGERREQRRRKKWYKEYLKNNRKDMFLIDQIIAERARKHKEKTNG